MIINMIFSKCQQILDIQTNLLIIIRAVVIKVAVSAVLSTLVKEADSGEFFMSGVRYVSVPTELSIEPDASFATWDWNKSAELVRIPTADGQDTIEMEGMPEW